MQDTCTRRMESHLSQVEQVSAHSKPSRRKTRQRRRPTTCSSRDAERVPDGGETLGDGAVEDPGTALVTGYKAGVTKQLQVVAGCSRGLADGGGHVARADLVSICLLYTSDAADDLLCVDRG